MQPQDGHRPLDPEQAVGHTAELAGEHTEEHAPWVPVFLGLTGLALTWAWGFALVSGCAVPWDCATSGQIDATILTESLPPF